MALTTPVHGGDVEGRGPRVRACVSRSCSTSRREHQSARPATVLSWKRLQRGRSRDPVALARYPDPAYAEAQGRRWPPHCHVPRECLAIREWIRGVVRSDDLRAATADLLICQCRPSANSRAARLLRPGCSSRAVPGLRDADGFRLDTRALLPDDHGFSGPSLCAWLTNPHNPFGPRFADPPRSWLARRARRRRVSGAPADRRGIHRLRARRKR